MERGPGQTPGGVLLTDGNGGVPLHLWVAPEALASCPEEVLGDLPEGSTWMAVSDVDPPPTRRPAVLVLDAADLSGDHRTMLLRLTELAQPGRPVVVGGTRDKTTLLDAINTWRPFRLVPRAGLPDMLLDAIVRGHEALNLQHVIALRAAELRARCHRLDRTVSEIRATRQQLLHAERLTTVSRITGSLTRMVQRQVELMRAFDQALERHVQDPDLGDMLAGAMEGTYAIRASLEDMRALTEERDGGFELEQTDLDQLVRRAGNLFALDPGIRDRQFDILCECGLQLKLDRHRTLHVLLNLLRNAMQATEPGEAIILRAATEGEWAVVEVEDTGCGIPEEMFDLVFKPFFSTKGPGGMGLGLSMCRSVVERQGGCLSVTSKPGRGSRFRITLPLSPPTNVEQ